MRKPEEPGGKELSKQNQSKGHEMEAFVLWSQQRTQVIVAESWVWVGGGDKVREALRDSGEQGPGR